MCFSSPAPNNSALEQQQAQTDADNAARQGRIDTGMTNIGNIFSNYNDDYFNGLDTDYDNYYTPQVDSQKQTASDKLLYAQANQGIVGTSAAAYENAQLDKEYAQDQQQVQSAGQDYANGAKSQVQTLRSNLTNQLQSDADPTSITPDALNQLNIQSVSSMTPLTNLFSDLTGTYGNYANNQALAGNTNTLGSIFNTQQQGGSSGGSGKVVTS